MAMMNLAKLKLLAPSIADISDTTLQEYLDSAWATFNDIWYLSPMNLATADDNVALALSHFIVMILKDIETSGTAAALGGGLIIEEQIGDYRYKKADIGVGSVSGSVSELPKMILQLMWKYPFNMPERDAPNVY